MRGDLFFYVGGSLTALAQLIYGIRWLSNRIATDKVARLFVRDMATNHLPHIYHALSGLCVKAGVEHVEPPPIRWVNLEDAK